MSIRCRCWGLVLFVLASLTLMIGCGSKTPEITEPVDAKPKGPNYEVFAPLKQATMDVSLPVITGTDEPADCFKPVEGLVYEEADVVLKEQISQHMPKIKSALAAWLVNELEPDGVSEAMVKKWDISLEDVVVMDLPRDQLRFVDDPQCLSGKGWVPEGQHVVVTYFGAKTFKFETSVPLNQDIQEELLQAVGMKNIVMESEAMFVYEPAMDEAGEPLLDPEGNQLYTSPSGDFIAEADVPPVEERKMKDWIFKSENPIYFAFKDFPKDAWRKEGAKDKCNIILIPEALTPQMPDCSEFQESGFSVSIIDDEDQPVSITIKTGEELKGVTLAWKEPTKVQVNDRIIVWLMPEKVEVGVNLWLNSLVINPAPLPEGASKDGEPGYGVPISKEKEAAAEEKKEEDAKKSKKKKKKKKKSSGNSIDDYLNE